MTTITDILKTDFGHVKIDSWILKCLHCGDECKSPKKPQSLQNHIYTVSGFVNMHKNCKPGGKSIWEQ